MIMAILLMAVCEIVSANWLSITDFSISAGETKEVSISMDNDDAYVAFQFDLYLPEGITLESYSANRQRIPESTTLSMARVSNGAYRFVAADLDSQPLIGYNGHLITLTVKAAETIAPNQYLGYFNNIKLSRQDATGDFIPWNMEFPVWVLEPTVVTAISVTRTYGEENPVFEYTYYGPELNGEPTITCNATATSPVGTYDIIISRGTVSNYNLECVHGTLTIEPAPLTVAAENYTKKQGDPLPEFTLTYYGFKNGETEEVLTVKPTVTTPATAESGPGEYPIMVSGGEAQNYELYYVDGRLIVIDADAVAIMAKSYTRQYGEDNPTFEYTVEGAELEGEPVIYCAATATSPVGTYDIMVSQGTVTNYNVTYVAGTLTIEPAPLTVAAGTYTKKQGDPLPEFTLTYTGFKNGETEDVLISKPTVSTTATIESAPGVYPVNVSGGEARNYQISCISGTLLVTEADPVTITARSYTREYGDANPTFEYTVEGAELVGQPTITCAATETSPVGTYDIVVRQGTVANYNATYIAGTLTITKAPLTIAAGTYTKKQGDPMPEFTLTYTGFKNDETKDVLMKQPAISCQATETSAPSEYPVTVSGAEAKNYELSYINGKLIVVDADPVTIIAKSYTRTYGEANPTFEYIANGAELVGQPTITCTATKSSPVGIYDILVTQGTVKNYNVAYVAGTLTITKAPLNIAAGTYTKKQGDPLPEFTLEYTGFKNNEKEDVLTKQPTISCEATEASAPGEYPVTVSGAEAKNYELSYSNGKLIIVDADAVVVIAKSYTREFGEENPTFEYTVEGTTLDGTPEITCEATATSPVGTYDILVKQGTVTNYNVTYIAGTLTITKAALNIAASTYTKKQGDPLPEFALTYTGFKNNETTDVLTKQPTISCEATEASAPGEYPVTVSSAEAENYNISYTNGKLVVIDADAIVIKAKSYTREYGKANPIFEYTTEGAELKGEPVITCIANETSPVGTYPIIVSKGTVTNYNVTYVAGTLTITKAPLTIAAGTYTKKQGEPMPEFTLTYTGFKNGETENVLTKQPTVSCQATAASAPGEYPVTVSGAEAQNYKISYTNGLLIVVDADAVVIQAKSYTREYGEANPTFEYTVEGATLEGTPEISCEATVTSPVGTYDIVVKQGTVTNYNVTYIAGSLTIEPAPLTVAAGTYTKKQGDPMPEFTLTYTGFKNSETEDVLTIKPTATTTATADSGPGEYPVTVSGGEARNYVFTYVDGTLIVTPLTAIDLVKVVGRAELYDLQGNKIGDYNDMPPKLPVGIYILRKNGKAVKISVK